MSELSMDTACLVPKTFGMSDVYARLTHQSSASLSLFICASIELLLHVIYLMLGSFTYRPTACRFYIHQQYVSCSTNKNKSAFRRTGFDFPGLSRPLAMLQSLCRSWVSLPNLSDYSSVIHI